MGGCPDGDLGGTLLMRGGRGVEEGELTYIIYIVRVEIQICSSNSNNNNNDDDDDDRVIIERRKRSRGG